MKFFIGALGGLYTDPTTILCWFPFISIKMDSDDSISSFNSGRVLNLRLSLIRRPTPPPFSVYSTFANELIAIYFW